MTRIRQFEKTTYLSIPAIYNSSHITNRYKKNHFMRILSSVRGDNSSDNNSKLLYKLLFDYTKDDIEIDKYG